MLSEAKPSFNIRLGRARRRLRFDTRYSAVRCSGYMKLQIWQLKMELFLYEGKPLKPVGIIPNPASGKDIRRLLAYGSVFDNPDEENIIDRREFLSFIKSHLKK